jgi:hypothetical protein
MYTRKQSEQQADIKAGLIDDFSRFNACNMLTESALGIIFALIQSTV